MQRVARDVSNETLLPRSQARDAPNFDDNTGIGRSNYAGLKKLGRRFAQAYISLIN